MQSSSLNKQEGLAPVSVIVVNYNAGKLLADCVNAALAQVRQVVVVDNASTDTSINHLVSFFGSNPRVIIIRNQVNLGFAAACNIGNSSCTEKHILYLNPDCILLAGTVAHLVNTLESNPTAGMVGGLLLDSKGTEQGGGRRAMPTPWRTFVRAFGLSRFSNRWPRLFYDFHLHKHPLPEKPLEVEAISGALMLVRREALDNVGSWDERYFLHCEDLDWCMRFRMKGWKILFDSKAPTIHFQGFCSAPRPIFVEWHKHKGMVRFYRKFFHHQYPGFLMWLVVLGVWIRFLWIAPSKAIKRILSNAALNRLSTEVHSSALTSSSHSPHSHHNPLAKNIAVVGASSMVGSALLPLLVSSDTHVIGYSRKSRKSVAETQVEWREMTSLSNGSETHPIEVWIWLAPIKALPQYLSLMQLAGAKHIVAVSTTSRFTKKSSSSEAERKFVADVVMAEDALQIWASENSTHWTILRPTLIYGLRMDKNICAIANFIRRFRFFPTLGEANGLRQPVHARDVAAACKASIERQEARNHAYNISGAEILSYREMVRRIFQAYSMRPYLIAIPLWLFGIALALLHFLPRFKSWSPAMAERMNQNMEFDHSDATRDLEFTPQPFCFDERDIPSR